MQGEELTHEQMEARMEAAAAHAKRLLVLRHLLIGSGYHEALTALEFAKRHTPGYRKDKVTPNFDHQVSIALHAYTLKDTLLLPEQVLATIMTHDLIEDEGISESDLRELFRNAEFAREIATATDLLSKEVRGVKRDEAALFQAMARNPIASIVKPFDRINNHQGMPGVFKPEKIRSYLVETETLILPMVKQAKQNFRHQTLAYENLTWTLKSQISLVRGLMPSPDPEHEPSAFQP